MASNAKQQKRAKRAASKAKEKRVTRNNISKNKDSSPPSIDELFATAMGAGLYDQLFEEMNEAQEISLTRMCRVFLADSLLAMVVSTYGEDAAADYIYGVLCAYRDWLDEADQDTATAWIQSPEFVEAYEQAAKEIEAEVAGEQ
ncbi:hypothetical protein [Pseudomonas huaxiensis]|uniref:hypothetical protein n=1 Tax=Pseudomonas huaxiensis TaxID=2213017 RepID=UPI000DA65CBC|nr:hypothetical protein [Pseudomonas huaxiensis]